MKKGELEITDIILSYVNANFESGDVIKEANNYKSLIDFIRSSEILFDLNENDYVKLLKNNRLLKMVKTLLEQDDNSIYINNPFFYSLAIVYSNHNKVKVDIEKSYTEDYDSLENDFLCNSSDNISLYLNDLIYAPYTFEEERCMFKRLAHGDKSVKNDIINHNLRLVVSIAKKYLGRGLEFEDLIQEGNIGLSIAVDRYNYTSGNKFSTYAIWWIRQTINRGIAFNSRTIRIPAKLYDMINRVDKYTKKYVFENNGKDPDYSEISHGTGLSIDKVKMIKELPKTISINAPVIVDDEQDSEVGDYIEDINVENPVNKIFYEQFRDIVFNTDILTDREKLVLFYRFGFLNNRTYKLDIVGNEIGLTGERIRQIEAKALRKLRTSCELKEFDMKRYSVKDSAKSLELKHDKWCYQVI